MARIFIDGFESGGIECWDGSYSYAPVIAGGANAHTGNYGCYCNGSIIRKILPTTYDTLYFSMWYKSYNGNNANRDIINLRQTNPSYYVFHLCCYNPPYVTAMVGHNIATYASTYTLTSGLWYLIEFYFYQHASAGAFTVKVNNQVVLDYSGINTGSVPAGILEMGNMYGGNYPNQGYFDDMVLDDANWIGDSRIYGISPSGAGNSASWTPSAGNNYECVDEVPASDADYVETNVADNVDTYAMADMPSVYEVKSVQVMARAQTVGSPTPANLALVVRPPTGGTDYAGSDQVAEASWRGHTELWENNPYTSSPWTESEVNGMEAGIKARA